MVLDCFLLVFNLYLLSLITASKGISELIKLEPSTGELVVGSRLDREQVAWLNFTIKATDSGVPPRSSFTEVVIQVIDENDNNPIFASDLTNLSIWENVTIGNYIITITFS